MSPPPSIAIITCDVMKDEIVHHMRGMDHVLRVEVLEQGLHNDPPVLRQKLQQAVDRVESEMPQVQAIVLGYGLCSRGVEGVHSRRCQLVLARAHDCITLLLGDKERYSQYVKDHPGTYWYSPGWNRCHVPPGPERHAKLLQEYRRKFDEDDAQFLMESEQSWFQSYNRAVFVDLGTPNIEKDLQFTRDCANWLGWEFDRQHGCPELLRDLLLGNWDEQRFLVLQPGQTPRLTADERVIKAVAVAQTEENAA